MSIKITNYLLERKSPMFPNPSRSTSKSLLSFSSSSSSSSNVRANASPLIAGNGQSVFSVPLISAPVIPTPVPTLSPVIATIGRERNYSPFYRNLEVEFEVARNRNNQPVERRDTYDSDDEGSENTSGEIGFSRIAKGQTVISTEMSMTSTYYGKKIKFKGNQLIFWARDMMEKILKSPERKEKIAEAVRAGKAIIKTPRDWLRYEGMFERMMGMAAKESEPFFGILNIILNESTSTTIEFKTKENSPVTYAHIHDQVLINFLWVNLGLKKYYYPTHYGMSYPDIVKAIECYKVCSVDIDDAIIAKRQLEIFKGDVIGEITPFDRFLAFFNAVLFGSETSRNSTSFVTGVIIVELISKGQLTYKEAFETVLDNNYAAYPMASPSAGKGNIVGYRALLQLSQEEADTNELSSFIGMKSSRETPNWAQIQLKEAILLKYWSKNFSHEPTWNWIPASEDIKANGHAVEFARRFNQNIVTLLEYYYLPHEARLLVYSKDALDHMPFIFSTPSSSMSKWKDPKEPKSTVTSFDALKWDITTDQAFLRQEKDRQEAFYDIQADIYRDFGDDPPY